MTRSLETLAFRPSTADDAARLAAVLVEGFETYAASAFAVKNTNPPSPVVTPAPSLSQVMQGQAARRSHRARLRGHGEGQPGQVTQIRARFDLPSGLTSPQKYVHHRHIVEHEDNDMMRPFIVNPAA